MTQFLQLHLLTSYPPANLNRDDLGRPKTAVLGGVQRLRVSSQSLKRAWRTSRVFQESLHGHLGTRTKRLGSQVLESMVSAGLAEDLARKNAIAIAGRFGKLKKEEVEIEQLAHLAPEELASVDELVRKLVSEARKPTEEELDLLRQKHRSADVALFGRMLAAAPRYNMEAAAQVAHAITTHEVAVEDDYFTAVDDLNRGEEDVGAGHVGEHEFAAGLFYLYVCVSRDLLVDNLCGDQELAGRTLRALVEAMAKVAPRGKQNSYASRAYASYILGEKGSAQPRSLSVAFLEPIRPPDLLGKAIRALCETRRKMDQVYGPTSDESVEMNAAEGDGSFGDLQDFVSTPLSGEGA